MISLDKFKESGVSYKIHNPTITIEKGNNNITLVALPKNFQFIEENNEIIVTNIEPLKKNFEHVFCRKIKGTYNALLQNAIIGVTVGHKKILKMIGSGYKSSFNSTTRELTLHVGYSHEVNMIVPKNINITLKANGVDINLECINKETVGIFAHNIKKIKKQNVYKKTGIFIVGQHFITKEIRKT